MKPFLRPLPPIYDSNKKKWLVVMNDGRQIKTFLHDDFEYYIDGCLVREKWDAGNCVYKSSGEFKTVQDALRAINGYKRRHGVGVQITTGHNDAAESEVMEF